jgi:hypothetical protein
MQYLIVFLAASLLFFFCYRIFKFRPQTSLDKKVDILWLDDVLKEGSIKRAVSENRPAVDRRESNEPTRADGNEERNERDSRNAGAHGREILARPVAGRQVSRLPFFGSMQLHGHGPKAQSQESATERKNNEETIRKRHSFSGEVGPVVGQDL